MLKVFRDNLKYLSWVLWLVIAVFILFVFVDFGATVPGGTAPSDAAAIVGDYEVSFSEFERTYRRTEDFYRQTYGEQFNRELAQQMGLPIQVLDGLIADKILLAEADRMGLRVTDDEVAQYIVGLPSFQLPDGRFVGEDRYSQLLRANGYTVEHFEEAVRTDLLSDKVRSVLSENLYVSDEEVVAAYKDEKETATIRYLRLPSDSLRNEITVSEEELEDYFSEHQEDFRIPERRLVDYLLIDPDHLRDGLEIPADEIRGYYDTHTDEFSREEQVRARHILLQVNAERDAESAARELEALRQRIESGEDFAALAAAESEDPGSRDRGGDLGLFGRGQMIREFEDAAFAAQPGTLVGPIETSFGAHLIEVLEHRPGGQSSFEQVQDEIRQRLLTERARSLAESRAEELADQLSRDGGSSQSDLRELAEATTGVTYHSTSPFAREDNVAGIGRATPFTVEAFELAAGESSEPVRLSRGWAILRLREIQAPRLPEFAGVRDEVREALLNERQLELAVSRLQQAREALQQESTLEELAVELDLAIEESTDIRRRGPVPGLGINDEITSSALAMEKGEAGGPIVHDRDVVLFEVTDRQRYDPQEFELQKERTREDLRLERLNSMLTSLVVQRREALGVRYDTQLLRNFDLVAGES
jgi:peptidyl-prolyl cis-trans isomerase D